MRNLRISVSAKIRGRKVQARTASVVCEGMEPAKSHSAVQGVRRLMQHSCGSARCQRSCVGARPPHHLRPRSSKVRLRRGSTCLLFLQALCHFCSALGPRCASGRARQKRHRAFRAGRKQPSAFAPGCWRRGCRPAPAHSVRQPLRPSARDLSLGLRPLLQSLAPVLRHCLPPSHAARHPLRRRLGARPDGQERLTFDPAMGRSGPGPGESLPTHSTGLCRRPGA